jgi:long-chain fatty acid transport protein
LAKGINDMNKGLRLPFIAAALLAGTSGLAFGGPATIDSNLMYKPIAGAMGGAGYTLPQEPSAAVFGNPATLTQFSGTHFSFGATYIAPDVKNTQTTILGSNLSETQAKDYIAPDVGLTHEIVPGLVMGLGLEVDAGLGVDYRNDPITIAGTTAGGFGTSIPLVVEIVSFNANLGLGYKVTPQLSVGASVTLGFGLLQLGTSGPSNLGPFNPAPFPNFGGTTSSVHDIGVGGSLGATYAVTPNIMTSLAYKSEVEYDFVGVLHTTVPTPRFQNLTVEMPQEVIGGVAFNNLLPNLLLEFDVVWKDWSGAQAFKDVYEDQWLFLVGGQYTVGPWKLRAGYSYFTESLRSSPNNTLGTFTGFGSLPLGPGAFPGAVGDLVGILQTAGLPGVVKHTISGGVGYDFGKNMTVNLYAAYSPSESVTYSSAQLNGVLVANGVVPGTNSFKGEVDIWTAGASLNFKF